MRFFWRIFISAWAVVMITTALTFSAARWLPDGRNTVRDTGFREQMVTLIAHELQRNLSVDPTTAVDTLVREHSLDFSPLLEIYVLDPEGNDILGRKLPETVSLAFRSTHGADASTMAPVQSHLQVRSRGLSGYMVVGREGHLPVARELARPGGRVLLVLIAVCVSAGASYKLTEFIMLPVHRLRLAGQRVAAGDRSVRVAHTVGDRRDDIAGLARDFDSMTERVDALIKSQQRLLRDVSHELRSPLARLQALFSIARQKGVVEGGAQIDRMEAEVNRLNELIGEILAYSRLEAHMGVTAHPTDIVDLVQNIVDDASVEAQSAGKDIVMHGTARYVMELDSGLIQRAVENVIRNALRYTADGTEVIVRIVETAGAIRILVDDHGPGVPEDALSKIFEPFYRAEASASAQSWDGGIGLAIAERSIRLHGGTISASNRETGGLRVEIVLPVGGREQ